VRAVAVGEVEAGTEVAVQGGVLAEGGDDGGIDSDLVGLALGGHATGGDEGGIGRGIDAGEVGVVELLGVDLLDVDLLGSGDHVGLCVDVKSVQLGILAYIHLHVGSGDKLRNAPC
jgi:hypothetical protein